jgi:hypothetical protein
MTPEQDHPIEVVYRAVSAAFKDAENKGQFPIREIDVIAKLRSYPGIVKMAGEFIAAREILAEKRVSRAWRWAAVVLAAALAGTVVVTVLS